MDSESYKILKCSQGPECTMTTWYSMFLLKQLNFRKYCGVEWSIFTVCISNLNFTDGNDLNHCACNSVHECDGKNMWTEKICEHFFWSKTNIATHYVATVHFSIKLYNYIYS